MKRSTDKHILYYELKEAGMTIAATGIGGALGTLFRYLLNVYTLFTVYPIGTVLENLAGSLLLGAFTGWFVHRQVRQWLKVGLCVGFCGGFTTMSTLAADTLFLTQSISVFSSFFYLTLSLFGGIALAFCGWILGHKMGRRVAEKKRLQSSDT